jgi:glycerophosphoryl diester phosphodiesterase
MGSSRDAVEVPGIDDTIMGARAGWRTDVGAVSTADVPSLIAHRGFAGENPENTVSTLRTAAAVADWVEIDCRPTADGACAVFHDPTLDRCTDLSGFVADAPGETVFSTEMRGGEPIPTLEAALDAVPSDTGIVLDLKGRHAEDPEDECWEWLDEALGTAAEAPHPILVSTFSEDALEAVEEHAPALPTAYLFEREPERALAVADRYDCAALHPSAELLLDGSDVIARAHEAGLAVHAWTVTDAEEAAALAALGVDGVIADYADVLTPVEAPDD